MYDCTKNFINGKWLNSDANDIYDIINPATQESGNGREWGAHGIEDFLEIKAVMAA